MTWWLNRLRRCRVDGGSGRIWFRRFPSTEARATGHRVPRSTLPHQAPRPAGDPSVAQQVCRSRCRDWTNCRNPAVDSSRPRTRSLPLRPLSSPCTKQIRPRPVLLLLQLVQPPPLLLKRPPGLPAQPDCTPVRHQRRRRRLQLHVACQKACPIWPALKCHNPRPFSRPTGNRARRALNVCALKRARHRNALLSVGLLELVCLHTYALLHAYYNAYVLACQQRCWHRRWHSLSRNALVPVSLGLFFFDVYYFYLSSHLLHLGENRHVRRRLPQNGYRPCTAFERRPKKKRELEETIIFSIVLTNFSGNSTFAW